MCIFSPKSVETAGCDRAVTAAAAGTTRKVAYDEDLIVTEEQLRIDLDEIRRSIENAHADAFGLSLSVAYPTMENMEMLVQVAHQEAGILAINAVIFTKETIKDLIRKAHAEMLSLSAAVRKS